MFSDPRDGRFAIYRAAKETTDIPALVPSRNCHALLLACGGNTECQWSVVCQHEPVCAHSHVLLLFPHCVELQAIMGPICHYSSDCADGCRYCCGQLLAVLQNGTRRYCVALPCTRWQCDLCAGDVCELSCVVPLAVSASLAGLWIFCKIHQARWRRQEGKLSRTCIVDTYERKIYSVCVL